MHTKKLLVSLAACGIFAVPFASTAQAQAKNQKTEIKNIRKVVQSFGLATVAGDPEAMCKPLTGKAQKQMIETATLFKAIAGDNTPAPATCVDAATIVIANNDDDNTIESLKKDVKSAKVKVTGNKAVFSFAQSNYSKFKLKKLSSGWKLDSIF